MLRPQVSAAYMADAMQRLSAAAGQPTLQAAKSVGMFDESEEELSSRKLTIAALMLTSLQRSLDAAFDLKANRRMAEVAIAVALFRSDEGRLPTTLSELVPAYLPAIPTDPRNDAAPFQYDAAAGAIESVVPLDVDRARPLVLRLSAAAG